MTHLYIELNTGLTEEVNSSIISKLYELAVNGNLDASSDLKGRLHSTSARDIHVAYLNTNYPDLHISADKVYITFEDTEVDRILTQKFGDGVGVTDIDMLSVTGINYATGFAENTTVLTFDELGRFSTIKSLYTYAFSGCSNLTSINLSNIEHVGGQAFAGTNLTGVINLPNVISIGDSERARSFGNCYNITEINIGSSFNADTTYMGYAFSECTNLEKVTGLNNITMIPGFMFCGCNKLSQVDIDWTKITSIGTSAFQQCSLLSINLANVATIYGHAFLNSSISGTVSLSSLATASGEYEFYNCKNITSISSIGNITMIDHHMFQNCTGLTQIPDLSTITGIIGYSAFDTCTSLTQAINIPNVTQIGGRAFMNSAISSVTLGQSCTGIDAYAFSSCKNLTSITIPKSVTYLEQDCFTGCTNLSSVSFESGSDLQYLGGGCFNGCSALLSITIPDSCEVIGSNCFINCRSLNHVEIGSGILKIGLGVFSSHDSSPGSVVLTIHATTPPEFPSYSGNQKQITAIYVPTGCVSVYEQHSDWSRFSGIIYEIQ